MRVFTIVEDSDGSIWLSSDTGVYRVLHGELQVIIKGEWVRTIRVIAPGVLVGITFPSGDPTVPGRLIRIKKEKDRWQVETILDSYRLVSLASDDDGHILYSCPGGLCEIMGQDIVNWHPSSHLAIKHRSYDYNSGIANAGFGAEVHKDKFGCLWVRQNPSASYECPGDKRFTSLPDGLVGVGATAILELGDGSIVLPSFGKVAIGRPGHFRVLSPQIGYPTALSATVTREGDLWVSTANGPYLVPLHNQIEFWTERDGLDGITWSILPTKDVSTKNTVFAVAGEEVVELNGNRRSWRNLVQLNAPFALHQGPDRTVLVDSFGKGITQISADGRILRKSSSDLNLSVIPGRKGELWTIGAKGVSKLILNGQKIDVQPSRIGSPISWPKEWEKDTADSRWFCPADVLLRLSSSGWQSFKDIAGIPYTHCGGLVVDRDKDIWTVDSSESSFSWIHRSDSGSTEVRRFDGASGIGTTSTVFFKQDDKGLLWRGAADGLYVADPAQARKGQWLRLDASDGFPSVDMNQNSFVQDSDGSIWVGANSAIIHLHPSEDLVHPKRAPPVFLSGFSSEGSSAQMIDEVGDLKSGVPVVAHVGSLQFDRRSAIRVRYRLLPEQSEWRSGSGFDFQLGKLHWGQHTVEMQAQLLDGPWSDVQRTQFKVLKPLWLTWPALGGYFAMAAAVMVGGTRWRRKRIERAKRAFPELGEWRLAALSPELHQLDGVLLDSRFKVGQILARGGFATVVEGIDTHQDGRRCAIKIFRQDLADKEWMARRFQQEVLALEQIRHPNVVRIYCSGITPSGSYYLAMELIEGKTLREVLDEERLPPGRIARYLREAGAALDQIHQRNICHRDLKPENLMIRSVHADCEELVLIDFSIAIVKDPDETLHGLSRAAGTIYYMAPEQAIGYANPSTDIYSLAKIIIEMLTGQRLSVLLPDASMDLPERVRELLIKLPIGFSASSIELLSAALEFDPSRRPSNAGEFANQIAMELERG